MIIGISEQNRERREVSTDYADYTDWKEADQRNLDEMFGLSSSSV